MRSYPFIEELFTNVLDKSQAIKGRFHICPKYGLEINSDQLGEVMQDLVKSSSKNKYPLALLMPPRSTGNYTGKNGEWENYRLVMFFLTTSFYNGANQVKFVNPNTQTSTHTIPEDWHDMKRCAVNFLKVLDQVQRQKSLITDQFRLGQDSKIFDPVSNIGADRASGVRLTFTASLFLGCELEDYNEADISSITVPAADSHPEHNQ